MPDRTIRVAVIGSGMAGRAHAAGQRNLRSLYGDAVPTVKLVAIADANRPLAADPAGKFEVERVETHWEAIAEADDVDAVSVVLPNSEHRRVGEGLAARGKAILCEKPAARTAPEAMAMAAPGLLGAPRQLMSRYLADHGRDAGVPFRGRLRHDLR